jgi:hypothetical protein
VAAVRKQRVEQRLTKQQQEDDLALNADDPTTTGTRPTAERADDGRATSPTKKSKRARISESTSQRALLKILNEPF